MHQTGRGVIDHPAGRRLSAAALLVVSCSLALMFLTYPTWDEPLARLGYRPVATLTTSVVGLSFSLAGWIIRRSGSNPVSWILHAIGACFAFTWVGEILHPDLVAGEPGVIRTLGSVWLGFSWFPALILMTVVLPLIFPTGRVRRGWGWVLVLGVGALLFGFIAAGIEALTGPFEEVFAEGSPYYLGLTSLLVLGAAGALASTVARYRKADIVERLQIKWVALSLALVCVIVAATIGAAALGTWRDEAAQWAPFVSVLLFSSIPGTIALAINRYQLYAIDRIVSRTFTYALLIGALAVVYTIGVIAIQLMVPASDDLAVAAATLASAAVFAPLRMRVQRWMDRRFNRTSFDVEREVEAFSHRITAITDAAVLESDLRETLARTLQPASLSVWFRG
ncbi:MAG TPA: hypothetical protein VFV13_03925 [Acidimicrobiia bacterium]|nr:hypothetical protein [Acidimicrobiia bacterium]